jgi:predicted nucleic acid-binding protein
VNVVDSSAWLEYFAGGPNAGVFRPAIHATDDLIVPTICLYEVYKKMLTQLGEGPAQQGLSAMLSGQVVDVDSDMAVTAARLSADTGLPMADSLILAAAHRFRATLWTQDADFDGLKGVRYVARNSPK